MNSCCARPHEPVIVEYLRAAELFVAEEQQHAALLLRLLGYLDGQPMRTHWSDAVFVRLRRLMGLRTELMVLTVAEVVALSYYGGLAEAGPDGSSVRWPPASWPTSTRMCGSSRTDCGPASQNRGSARARWHSRSGG